MTCFTWSNNCSSAELFLADLDLLSTNYIPGPVLGIQDIAANTII